MPRDVSSMQITVSVSHVRKFFLPSLSEWYKVRCCNLKIKLQVEIPLCRSHVAMPHQFTELRQWYPCLIPQLAKGSP